MLRFYYVIIRNILRIPAMVYQMRRMIAAGEKYSEADRYRYVRFIVKLMQVTGHIRTKGFGLENLPKEGGYMMYPNHQGKYDAYGIVAVHEKPCTVVMDIRKSYIIFIREILDMLKGKRLDKQDVRQNIAIINEVAEEVSAGRKCVLFAEGDYDRKKKNTLWDFKAGSFKIALKSKVPVVPVVLYDSYKVYNSFKLGIVTTQVHFLEPIYYEEYQGMKTKELAELVKSKIQTKLDELNQI